jgi:hypothetical protein
MGKISLVNTDTVNKIYSVQDTALWTMSHARRETPCLVSAVYMTLPELTQETNITHLSIIISSR